MKKIFLMLAMVSISLLTMAQNVQWVWMNGRMIYGTEIDRIDSLTYGGMADVDTLRILIPRTSGGVILPNEPNEPNEPINRHEYVDLGLPSGLKWATCNVGATTPEEYGDYFAWGEVEPKTTYNWSTYKYGTASDQLTKYCNNSSYGKDGFTDNKTVLDPEDDAATANWGGAWRMPTEAELDELRDNCTWNWTTQNGVKGYKVTGPNGNSIFLPTAGCMREGTLCDAGSYGYYWSSSLDDLHPDYAYGERFDSGNVYFKLSSRCFGQSVRPVCQ